MKAVYTLGYIGWTLDQIAAKADELSAVVVDVRLVPRSRVPWANQGPLRRGLGARYEWVRELGNLNYKGGPVNIVSVERGLKRIGGILAGGRAVILLCACRLPDGCHRAVVADAAAQWFGMAVVHLVPPVKEKPARVTQPELF